MVVSEYVKAIVLGVVQGVAEFLPISSSGHLVIANELLGRYSVVPPVKGESFLLTVALHVGTLFSILVVYRHDLWRIYSRASLCRGIVIATLPLVAIGFGLLLSPEIKAMLDALFASVLIAGFGLMATAVLLLVGQRLERGVLPLDDITPRQAAVVGLFQAIAIAPGISRSGSTIAAGLVAGLRRDAATTFSFFIAIPAIAGAGALAAKDAWQDDGAMAPGPLLAGAVVSFVVGLFALRWLIRLVSQQKLHWFAWYCAAAGTATVAWQLAERITAAQP